MSLRSRNLGIASYPGGPFPDSAVGEDDGLLMRVARIGPLEAESPN